MYKVHFCFLMRESLNIILSKACKSTIAQNNQRLEHNNLAIVKRANSEEPILSKSFQFLKT